ncbi:cupin domain-containing protein [Marinobacterium weihaiense]|uniref:Cupin domain-containing protein n=1 Tax=Marinobacterium weihaiense TaxID=2851016 RepID=A0ABS6M662_9GAMM|nr:cupin domain-containing protein [Marinobacterium weihaiense]MBV0931762.1 cupin domain-containing protein [Marinobacterium weihaiense]
MTEIHWGDLSAEQFLREYWQKKPLLIRNAFPDFEPCISADELAGLACEEDVESRLIETDPDSGDWSLEHGPFDEDRFATLGHKPWTLLVQAVDHWVPDVAPLLQAFDFIPQWRRDDLMISYASDQGGVGPHYDNYDVFLLQAEGVRCWEFGGLYGEDSPRRENTPVMILPQWHAEHSVELQPGDMLYLPPRVGHNGVGVGDGCMTWSIGFRAPSHAEILQGLTSRLCDGLSSDLRYEDPDLEMQPHPGEIGQDAIARVQGILRQYLDDPAQLAGWLGQFMTEPKYPELNVPDAALTEAELSETLTGGAQPVVTEGARLAFHDDNEHFTLFADGQVFALCAPAAIALAKQLCANQVDTCLDDRESRILLLQLINQGSVYLHM